MHFYQRSVLAMGIAAALSAAPFDAVANKGNMSLAARATLPGSGHLEGPAAPTHLRASWWFSFIRNARVVWRDNSNDEDGFIVEWWNDDPSLGWVLVETAIVGRDETSVSFAYPGLNGKRNRFRAGAFNALGESEWSGWTSLTFR